LGYQKQSSLQQIEESIFQSVIDECIKRKVDFVLIPGDLFHINIPEMRVQKFAFRQFRKLHEMGIPVYVVYGSHDFSPISNSVIDLLTESGYLTKVSVQKDAAEDKIVLGFTQDPKTNAKIVGLPGLSAGKEHEYYQKLDRNVLEIEEGFKIFLFHAGINELKTKSIAEGEFMPVSLLPKGFDYYAGGHIHNFLMQEIKGYGKIAYSGTTFAGYHSDLEENAKGMKRGFILVEFDNNKVHKTEFIPIENPKYEIIEYNANGKKSASVNIDLFAKIKQFDPADKIIIIKIFGELISGKTTEIEFTRLREELKENKAKEVLINRNSLSSKEYLITPAIGQNKDEIETNVFKENIGDIKIEDKKMQGQHGVKVAKSLLQEVRQPLLVNENKFVYQKRIDENAFKILELDPENDS
jgi:DNA repair exonuclease SbcCD nuclease subunit